MNNYTMNPSTIEELKEELDFYRLEAKKLKEEIDTIKEDLAMSEAREAELVLLLRNIKRKAMWDGEISHHNIMAMSDQIMSFEWEGE